MSSIGSSKVYESDILALKSEIATLNKQKQTLETNYKTLLADESIYDTISSNKRLQSDTTTDLPEPINLDDPETNILTKKHRSNNGKGKEKDTFEEDYSILKNFLSNTVDLSNLKLENVYRLTGITGFKVSDPAPQGDKNMLGIRIETFSKGKYTAPHYVIIRKDMKDRWEIFKHTVPVYIPIKAISDEYLNRDLKLFSEKLRRYIILHIHKQDIIDSMDPLHRSSTDTLYIERLERDLATELVKIFFKNGWKAVMTLSLLSVEQVTVSKDVDLLSTRSKSDKNLNRFERNKELETILRGSIEELPKRIKRFWSRKQ